VKRTILNLAVVLVALSASVLIQAQTRARNTAAPVPSVMTALPESDAVAHVKVKQLLNEAMPRILANNPAKLAEVNANIDKFKDRTGLDPRMFEQVALGIRYTYPSEGVTKVQTVALANGSFSAAAMVAAGRIATNGKYREEKYHDKTVYIFTLEENIKMLGVFDFKIGELAAAPLNNNVLALGDPAAVRGAIDASRSGKQANAELIALASRDLNAIIGFGSNMTEQLVENLDIGNAPIAADLKTLRQVYGSVGTTASDLQLFLGARAVNAEAARSLSDTLDGLKQLGAFFVGRLSGAKGVLAKSALSNLTIVANANELQLRTSVAQAEVGPLLGN
jgi:rRNA maturation endonuclease Nob1